MGAFMFEVQESCAVFLEVEADSEELARAKVLCDPLAYEVGTGEASLDLESLRLRPKEA